ncbi:DNA gyrase inhibitor [Chlamydia abortus]|jgi:AraC family transcriptional regulator|uniref:GyrI-like domain-containing protein n=1 Tax=Paenibacillus residui TaxID=629724 RepID=A0ABW3D4X4_9BACL|nr:GyrI-like domain-containing protein [Paenibacillus sp. 32O-W]SHE12716.1 DNA gyrase inhibitor [Chlamydia abortus]
MIIETKLVHKPAFRAVGIQEMVHFSAEEKPSENAIAKLWDRLNARTCEIADPVGYRGYGLIHQTPETKPGDPFNYIAAVGVHSFGQLPEGMISVEVPASLYAVVTYRGVLDGLGEGFEYFWSNWLPQSEYVYEGMYEFEFYDQRYRNRTDPESEIDLYFPISPKGKQG